MTKISKIAPTKIRKISGGQDPTNLIEEFMSRRGFSPEQCVHQKSSDLVQWVVPLKEEEDLEITLEGLSRPAETTLYMGINVMAVPIKNCHDILVSALTVADTLIGAKLSLVNYDLVLSVTVYTANLSIDDLDYYFELITRQKTSVQEAIAEDLL